MSKSLNNDYADEKDIAPRKKKAWNAKRVAPVELDDTPVPESRKDVNTFIIGSRSITLKPLSLERVGTLVGKKLTSVKHSHPEDLPAHYVIVNGTIWILAGQSHVNFDGNKDVKYLGEDIDEVTFGTLPVVYCRDSKVKIGNVGMGACDQNILINSRLTLQTGYIKNLRQINATINTPDITACSALVDGGYLASEGFITLNRCSLERVGISGVENINIKCAVLKNQNAGSEYKSVTIDGGESIRNFGFRIDTCMTKRHIDLVVKKRIDYGEFSAALPVSFIRANDTGMVINGVYTDFDMHTRFVDKFKTDIGETSFLCNGLNDNCVNQEDYLEYIRFIHDMAFGQKGGRYIPDRYNAIENNMMLGLMEQMRSRLNLYKQLSVLDAE